MRVLPKIYRPTLDFENAAYSRGFRKIAGIDEAGSGPLAGPVVVAAVILGKNWKSEFQLNDSKQLSAKRRNELFDIICAVNSVNVAAPSSKERPLAKDTSKSFISYDLFLLISLL